MASGASRNTISWGPKSKNGGPCGLGVGLGPLREEGRSLQGTVVNQTGDVDSNALGPSPDQSCPCVSWEGR